MKVTYKFFHKAEDDEPIDKMTFECETWSEIEKEVRAYSDVYNLYAWRVIKVEHDKEPEPEKPASEKKVWTEEEIKRLIQTDDRVLYGALKKLYACQTADEQYAGDTRERNGKGFNSLDAKFLTSISEFLLKTGFLTYKQKAIARKKLVKYTKQLTRLANV